MTKTQKTLLVTAAIAGLVAGAAAKAKLVSNDHAQCAAGCRASSDAAARNACNGCPGKTNTVARN